MKKTIVAFAVFCCALLYAQNGFAYSNVNEGCTTCHSKDTLHAGAGHTTCTNCHVSPSGAKDVAAAKCAVCHPTDSGACNLVKAHASQNCTTCHADCKSTCPAATVLGDDDPRLGTLRHFRDKVLAKSAFGKRIINIYYNNEDAINAALEKNPTLKAFSYKALESFIPVAEIFM